MQRKHLALTMVFQRTVTTPLSLCLTLRVHPIYSLPPPPAPRSRLHTLTKSYRRKTCGADHLPFSHLPPDEKFNARKLHQKSRAKRGRSLTQPKDALLGVTAASNARRVKDKWWARSMRARKGWRTRLEREFGELLHLAQMRALSGWRHQADYETGAGWTRASRLWGI
jgi:hypothetical protein